MIGLVINSNGFGGQISTQIRTLTKQFATIGGPPNSCCHQSNPCFEEEGDEYNVEDELVNLFAERRARREEGASLGAKQH